MVSVEITAVFAALLAMIQIAFTMRVIGLRFSSHISLGDGGNDELLKRMRAHGNFVETVPMALMLLLLNEMSGTGVNILYGLGGTLVVARLLHYVGVAFKVPLFFRFIGMLTTIIVILALAVILVI